MNSKNWIRVLKVRLTRKNPSSKGQIMTFGENEYPFENLYMNVRIYKYMSSAKDNALITITNLTYTQIVEIILSQFYSVEIICGYKYGNQYTAFKGQVLRISNTLNDDRTYTVNILCASDLIGRFSQATLNFSLNSGINMYSAISFLAKASGMNKLNVNLSTQLKKQFLTDNTSTNDTMGSFLSKLTNNNPFYILNSDSSNGATFSIYDARKSNNRVIRIKNEDFIGGFPNLDSEGLTFSVLPSYNFMPGDVIVVDNSKVNLQTITNINSLSEQPGMFLDKNGAYMIMNLDYNLCNRSKEFTCNVKAKARSLISNYIGEI